MSMHPLINPILSQYFKIICISKMKCTLQNCFFIILSLTTQEYIYPSLVMVQPRKTRPYITERLLMGHKESNQTKNKTTQETDIVIREPYH